MDRLGWEGAGLRRLAAWVPPSFHEATHAIASIQIATPPSTKLLIVDEAM